MARQKRHQRQIAVVVYPGLTTLELIGTVSVLDGLGFETGLQPSVWSGIATLPIFA